MSETRVDEIAPSIYRISTSVPPSVVPGGFTLNQFLVVDEEPLLFHTGGRRQFDDVREAVARVMPIERLRWISFSHVEADECGSLNEWLAVAPHAAPVCGRIAALVSVNDLADRPPRVLGDGESLPIGDKRLTWIDAPHVPHSWECGFLFEERTRTLLAGDLLTQGGEHPAPLTDGDILGPSEAFRAKMDYYSHSSRAGDSLERMAQLAPATIACMHGSSYRGDGARLLRALTGALGAGT